jgi:hypothetical protein
MNAEKKDPVKNEGPWKAVQEAFDGEIPDHLEKELEKNLSAFRQDMREHPYVRRPQPHGFSLWRKFIFFSRPWFRPLLLAGMGLAVVVVIGFFVLGNKPPTWAEVQERFGSMPFFAASIYYRDGLFRDQTNPLCEPKIAVLWAGHGKSVRILSGSKVTFFDKGEILKTFDLITRSEDYPDGPTYHLVTMLRKPNTNVLDSFLMPFVSKESPLKSDLFPESLYYKKYQTSGLVDTTSFVISDPVVSKDLVVFDIQRFFEKYKASRTRVWALRESRLPVRVVVWLQGMWESGQLNVPYLDVIFTYSKEQPEKFFDPEEFASQLKDPSISVDSLMYMFHEFPGGDSIPTPGR